MAQITRTLLPPPKYDPAIRIKERPESPDPSSCPCLYADDPSVVHERRRNR